MTPIPPLGLDMLPLPSRSCENQPTSVHYHYDRYYGASLPGGHAADEGPQELLLNEKDRRGARRQALTLHNWLDGTVRSGLSVPKNCG